jgi:hypothetical protein
MKLTEPGKTEMLFKHGEFDIRRENGELLVLYRGVVTEQLTRDPEVEKLLSALLDTNQRLGQQNDTLVNKVAYLAQDNIAAWSRHAMANRIGADTAQLLIQAKDRIRELEAEVANLKASTAG